MAIPALSEKLPKWHFLTPAWNSKKFWAKCLLLMHCESAIYPKVSQAPSKCFFKWINWIDWIKSRIPRWIWKILLVLSFYEFLAMLEGKIGKGPFLGFNLMNLQCALEGTKSFYRLNFLILTSIWCKRDTKKQKKDVLKQDTLLIHQIEP